MQGTRRFIKGPATLYKCSLGCVSNYYTGYGRCFECSTGTDVQCIGSIAPGKSRQIGPPESIARGGGNFERPAYVKRETERLQKVAVETKRKEQARREFINKCNREENYVICEGCNRKKYPDYAGQSATSLHNKKSRCTYYRSCSVNVYKHPRLKRQDLEQERKQAERRNRERLIKQAVDAKIASLRQIGVKTDEEYEIFTTIQTLFYAVCGKKRLVNGAEDKKYIEDMQVARMFCWAIVGNKDDRSGSPTPEDIDWACQKFRELGVLGVYGFLSGKAA